MWFSTSWVGFPVGITECLHNSPLHCEPFLLFATCVEPVLAVREGWVGDALVSQLLLCGFQLDLSAQDLAKQERGLMALQSHSGALGASLCR
jgi:hypothetical protein